MKDLDYYMRLDYPVIIRRLSDGEGGGYVASIPLLGEYTFTAAGDTVEEALRILEDVKRDHFGRMLELGIEMPEPVVDDDELELEDWLRLSSETLDEY